MEDFKEGAFDPCKLDKAEELCTLLKDFNDYMENPFSRRMIVVMLKLQKNGKYNHLHMLHKLDTSGQRIEDIESPKSIIANMEQIANFKSRERVLIH